MFITQAYAAPIANPSRFTNLGSLVWYGLNAVVAGGGMLLFIYLLFGAFKYMTAGGDDKAVGEAKKTITNAVIGMVLLFCSWWIMQIVETILGTRGTPFGVTP